MTAPAEASFREAVAAMHPDTALIARHFAATELDKIAVDTEARVAAAFTAAVFDAITMTDHQREHMIVMILADVTS